MFNTNASLLVVRTIHVQNSIRKFDQLVMGPTMILGATCAPLDHSFILRIFKEFFEYVFQKTLKIFKFLKILLRCILNIPKYVLLK